MLGGVAKAKGNMRGKRVMPPREDQHWIGHSEEEGICQFAELPKGSWRDGAGPRDLLDRVWGAWGRDEQFFDGKNLPINWGICHNIASATLNDCKTMRGTITRQWQRGVCTLGNPWPERLKMKQVLAVRCPCVALHCHFLKDKWILRSCCSLLLPMLVCTRHISSCIIIM